MDLHQIAEARGMRYVETALREMERDPKRVLAIARENLARAACSPAYVEEWRRLLARPPTEILAFLRSGSDHAQVLRSCNPFAGVLSPRERWRIWREVGEAHGLTSP